MFNKKIQARLKVLDERISYVDNERRDKYYELRHDIDLLVAALGLVKNIVHKVEYVKKGGPEKP